MPACQDLNQKMIQNARQLVLPTGAPAPPCTVQSPPPPLLRLHSEFPQCFLKFSVFSTQWLVACDTGAVGSEAYPLLHGRRARRPLKLGRYCPFASTALSKHRARLTAVLLVFSDHSFPGQKGKMTRLCCDCRGNRGLDPSCGNPSCSYQHSTCNCSPMLSVLM